jgi:hypothetical protein
MQQGRAQAAPVQGSPGPPGHRQQSRAPEADPIFASPQWQAASQACERMEGEAGVLQ